jgi:hypothetical protein
MKVNNVDKFIDAYGNVKYAANLELFISKRREEKASAPVRSLLIRKQGNLITKRRLDVNSAG